MTAIDCGLAGSVVGSSGSAHTRRIAFDRPRKTGERCGRYRRRWIVERSDAWLGKFRRLVVRYQRSLTISIAHSFTLPAS